MRFPIDKLRELDTPFYFYDTELLQETLDAIKVGSSKYGYHVHYAVKANANIPILKQIQKSGFGADCVSGNEVKASIEAGFSSDKIVYAGVGKTDKEINLALDSDIFCFNVESIPELDVINELAQAKNKVAKVALRLNPNVNANTHHYITTGLEENKFGIYLWDFEKVVDHVAVLANVKLVGLHFHIGSQITDLQSFVDLCVRVNEIQEQLDKKQVTVEHINVGGGLGIDYEQPENNPICNFDAYFEVFNRHLELRRGQTVHFELGRSVVAQCGTLVSKVMYVKEGVKTKFAIVDAGMNDLIRPALYQAYHKIENLTSTGEIEKYDVVGPVCESSDCFGKAVALKSTKRGDLIAIRSAGAYGEIMASRYNLKDFAEAVYSNEL